MLAGKICPCHSQDGIMSADSSSKTREVYREIEGYGMGPFETVPK